ncbi:MAG TPA: hydrogenase maturation protease [Candidatus Thermoplasmatota archaeon]|nr:hydrogenase maturation protease [Candidatus Thermoplasmatota archaeon]
MKTIVLGVGNPILRDDGVGIHVIDELRKRDLTKSSVTLDTAFTGGLNILDMIRGYDKVIMVDAITEEQGTPGEVKRFLIRNATSLHSANPHDVSLAEAITLANNLGETGLPKEIILVGIVIRPSYDFGENLSAKVRSAIPTAVQVVLSELQLT